MRLSAELSRDDVARVERQNEGLREECADVSLKEASQDAALCESAAALGVLKSRVSELECALSVVEGRAASAEEDADKQRPVGRPGCCVS